MSDRPLIDVYSTFARDMLIQKNTGTRQEQPGGPGLFIQNVFTRAGVPFVMHTGPMVDVEILMTDEGEFGNVKPTRAPEHVPACETGYALVSTLFQEWNPEALAALGAELYVDVQGFVRMPGSFGTKCLWTGLVGSWTERISILKATEQELGYLPVAFVEEQKERILVVTKGKNGVSLYVKGESFDFLPSRVVETEHAIGAGDTFFAALVVDFVRGVPIPLAVQNGMAMVVEFLESVKSLPIDLGGEWK